VSPNSRHIQVCAFKVIIRTCTRRGGGRNENSIIYYGKHYFKLNVYNYCKFIFKLTIKSRSLVSYILFYVIRKKWLHKLIIGYRLLITLNIDYWWGNHFFIRFIIPCMSLAIFKKIEQLIFFDFFIIINGLSKRLRRTIFNLFNIFFILFLN